jgi:hypothetical protein
MFLPNPSKAGYAESMVVFRHDGRSCQRVEIGHRRSAGREASPGSFRHVSKTGVTDASRRRYVKVRRRVGSRLWLLAVGVGDITVIVRVC